MAACDTAGKGYMGRKDLVGKSFFADRERFAELMNIMLYHGESVVKAKNLIHVVRTYPSPLRNGEKSRDILMKETAQNICYGLELETEEDYVDAGMYRTDLREFFHALQCRGDKKELNALLHTERFRNLKDETEWVIAVYLDRKKLTEKMKQEGIGMCQALDELMEDKRREGKREGKIAGRKEEKRAIIRRMLQEGMDRALVSRITECTNEEMELAMTSNDIYGVRINRG